MEECPIITCNTSLGIPSPKLMVQAKVWRAVWVVKGKLQPRAKPTFQELVVLLVGSDVKFVVIPFQNLLDIGKDRVMNSSPTFILCPPM